MSALWELIDGAMCSWEHVLPQLAEVAPPEAAPSKWNKRCKMSGKAALRQRVAEMAPSIYEAYRIATAMGYEAPFDSHFVPAFLERATDSECNLLPDWRAVAQRIGRQVE